MSEANVIRPPEQLWIAGTKPPDLPDNEKVKTAIYHWLDRKVNQKRAGEETRMAHAQMIASLEEAKLDWHPYIDPVTNRKRRVWVAKEPKAKTSVVAEYKPKRGRRKRGGADRSGDAIIAPDDDGKVESRRVPRKSVASEIDPFGATREAMAGSILEDAEAVQRGEPRPPHANGVKTKQRQPKKARKRR